MSLIVLDYIAFIQVFASPLMDTKPVASVILTMMLSVTALLLLASYVRCISADNTIPLDPFFQTILQVSGEENFVILSQNPSWTDLTDQPTNNQSLPPWLPLEPTILGVLPTVQSLATS